MTCKEFTDMVPAFLEDTLDDISLREFLEHYDKCQGCREELEIQFLIDRVFNRMGVADGINLEKDLPDYIDRERKLVVNRFRLSGAAVLMELLAIAVFVLTAVLYLT